jgi:PAS domain S-box-containing protein
MKYLRLHKDTVGNHTVDDETLNFVSGIVECAGNPVAVINHEYKLIIANDAYLKTFGNIYGRNLRPGENITNAMKNFPDSSGQIINLLDYALSGKKIAVNVMLGKNTPFEGRYKINFSPVKNTNGETVAAIQALTNIEKNNCCLTGGHIYLRQAIHATGSYFCDWDIASGRVSRAEHIYEILGFTPEETEPSIEWWLDRVHPEDREEQIKRHEGVLEGDIFENASEFRIRHRNGHYVSVSSSWHPIFNPQGKPTRIIGILTDITDRKQAETALRENERLLRKILDSLFVFVGVLSPEGILTEVNRTALHVAGTNEEEVIGKFFEETCWWSHDRDVQNRIKEAVGRAAKGEKLRFDTTILTREHEIIDIDFQIVPVFDSEDNVLRLVPSAIDITDRKRAEGALEQRERHKDNFLAILAHELRNPLAPLCNSVQLLKTSGLDEETYRECIDILDEQTSFISRLVEDLLDVSRINQAKVKLNKKYIRTERIIERAVNAAMPKIEACGHELIVRNDCPKAQIYGDFTKLSQILINIVNNAAEYTPAGGRIEVNVYSKARNLIMEVKDNGVGIPESKANNIFNMYIQAGNNIQQTTGKGDLGMGLAIAKEFTEMHGGFVEVYSEGEGKGSTFTISLPLSARAAKTAA